MAYASKEIVFITGANTGLGFQIAKKLLKDYGDRFYCFVGSRTLSKGEAAVKELHEEGLSGCEAIPIDVSNIDSIRQAAKTVDEKAGRVDVLHANVSTQVTTQLHVC
jgi:NAD(P)-dependent dehydrogenase (short-subunit alcohol dehydrogenase family)